MRPEQAVSIAREQLAFRPDIEGLRAVAILLVVAAHAGVPRLGGGFVGVDVFFVLSGYLITRILTDELARTGRVQFARFYARRFLRLLPALLLMLGVTSLLGAQLAPISQQVWQADAAIAAALWASNLLFAFSRLDYFGRDASENLFLHTWSLGVEEQFYLAWPLLLLIGYGTWRRPVSPGRLNLIQLLWLLASISFAACVFITSIEPRHAFYLMPMRAWQFALGGLASLHFADGTSAGSGKAAPPMRLLGWAGLGLVVGSALALDSHTTYPGAWALLPTLGTLAVLTCGARAPQTPVIRLLSQPAMTTIGRISYSWYLWHWPILLLGAMVVPTPNGWLRLLLVMLSLLLARLSWRFVEAPIRRSATLARVPYRTILGALALMACTTAIFSQWQAVTSQSIAAPAYQRYQLARYDLPIINRKKCDQWYHSDTLLPCEFGNPKAGNTLVVLGDSIGLQWFPAIESTGLSDDWRIMVMTKSACPVVDEPFFYARIGREYTECARWRNAALARIAEIAPDMVIFGSSHVYGFTQAQWHDGTARILRRISPVVGEIYILRSTPTLPFDGPDCIAPRGALGRWIIRSNCTVSAQDTKSDAVFRELQAAASGFSNVQVVDMTDIVCPDHQCSAERNGMPVYRDSSHLTAGYTASLGPIFAQRMGLEPKTPER